MLRPLRVHGHLWMYECSQPASKSSWDRQDFGDISMMLKMAHFRKSTGPQWVNRTFDTGRPIHVNWLPLRVVHSCNSAYFVVRFPLSDEHTWVSWQEHSIGADSESLLTAQPSHIWREYKNFTQDIIYALCTIEPSCLHSLNSHYLYNSIYPDPCWDDSNYSYLSSIHCGTNVCDHSAIYRKFISVEWVADDQKT